MPQRCYSALEGSEVLKEAEFLVVLTLSLLSKDFKWHLSKLVDVKV